MTMAEEHLRQTFGLVNDWLRFAEAKNGALLAANSGLIFGTAKLSSSTLPGTALSVTAIALFGVAVAVAFVALSPSLTRPQWKPPISTPAAKRNPLYFLHIAEYEPSAYLTAIRHFEPSVGASDPSAMEVWLSDQIVTNARIGAAKFVLFERGLRVTGAGLAIAIVEIARAVMLGEAG